MKKLLLLFLMANTYAVNIGVIVPIQHVAMDAIVEGIQTTLKPALSKNDKIIIKNANSDINLQRQIIQQMVDNGVDYFLPIGKMASQMTLSIVKSKPVIAVAVDKATMKENEGRIGAVIDEIDVTITLDVIKNSLKKIEKIGLVYGNSEKVFPEIERAKTFCKKNGLKLFLRKADTVAEVVPNVNSLITQVDALLILKDFTVVSAMGGIAEIAYKSQTLVIASDAGSVKMVRSVPLEWLKKLSE